MFVLVRRKRKKKVVAFIHNVLYSHFYTCVNLIFSVFGCSQVRLTVSSKFSAISDQNVFFDQQLTHYCPRTEGCTAAFRSSKGRRDHRWCSRQCRSVSCQNDENGERSLEFHVRFTVLSFLSFRITAIYLLYAGRCFRHLTHVP